MKATCACRPGSVDNGWHERRCDECREAEQAAFARAVEMTRSPEFLARFMPGEQP